MARKQMPTSWLRLCRQAVEGVGLSVGSSDDSEDMHVSSRRVRHILVGGLVAMGLDDSGRYLLTVSHSGRGVFSTENWERVARDDAIVHPTGNRCPGIGPLQGQIVVVATRDELAESIRIHGEHFEALGESDGVTVTVTAWCVLNANPQPGRGDAVSNLRVRVPPR